jgi:hypothetical protein
MDRHAGIRSNDGGQSSLTNTPKLTDHLGTWKSVIEEHGWLMYAVFLSLQSGVAISDSANPPGWIFWLNLGILVASISILAIAYVARFDDGTPMKMKPPSDAPIQRLPAALVAVAAATVGYLAMSAGKVL